MYNIKISPSNHLQWRQRHRQKQKRLEGFHKLNQDKNFEAILKGEIKNAEA